MTTAVSYAIDHVKFVIPRPILEKVFLQRSVWARAQPMTIDAHIFNEVIRARVLPACDMIGGTEVYIDLGDVPMERVDLYTTVYRIPKEKTQGRSIMNVLNITFSDPTGVTNMSNPLGCQNTEMLNAGQAVMNAMGTLPITSTSQIQLIGDNVVLVRDVTQMPANLYLRCTIAYDETMANLQPRSYRYFAKLTEYAVKAYVYNEYIIQMDVGELHGGQQLGRFKEIIDGYSEAEELYQTYLYEKMGKIFRLNDTESLGRLYRTVIGGRR